MHQQRGKYCWNIQRLSSTRNMCPWGTHEGWTINSNASRPLATFNYAENEAIVFILFRTLWEMRVLIYAAVFPSSFKKHVKRIDRTGFTFTYYNGNFRCILGVFSSKAVTRIIIPAQFSRIPWVQARRAGSILLIFIICTRTLFPMSRHHYMVKLKRSVGSQRSK